MESACAANRASYSEALVNSLEFNYVENKPELENRSRQQFLAANETALITIFKELDTKTDLTTLEKIQKLSESDLMEHLETFTKKHLSAGSGAETHLKKFFSAMVLCPDNLKMREFMLKQQREEFGSKSAKFMELLTDKASHVFWKQVGKDLQKPQETIFSEFEKTRQAILKSDSFNQIDPPDQTKLTTKINKFITAQQDLIQQKIAALDPYQPDNTIPRACSRNGHCKSSARTTDTHMANKN
jgi:hypothetical protein